MPQACCVVDCKNRRKKGANLQFFKFPLSNEERLTKWIEAVNREDFKPTQYTVICSDHFTSHSYLHRPGTSVPRLRNDAVPSIFLYTTKELQRKQDTLPVELRQPIPSTSEEVIPIECFEIKIEPTEDICSNHFTTNNYLQQPGTNEPVLSVFLNSSQELHKKQDPLALAHPEPIPSTLEEPYKIKIEPQDLDICSNHLTANSYLQQPETSALSYENNAVTSTISYASQELDRKQDMLPVEVSEHIPSTSKELTIKIEPVRVSFSTEAHLRKKVKILQQKLRRKEKKISALKNLVNILQNKNKFNDSSENLNARQRDGTPKR